ncbi:hypothetical protein BDV19DRAFT_396854 [Aspergillus venezuelensis]
MKVTHPLPTSGSSSSYTLTALDHLVFPIYLGGKFDLRGKDRYVALKRLQTAAAKLCAHLPVLTGSVVPAADTEERFNAFEIKEQPASNPLLIDGRINPEFLPEPVIFDPSGPCPVVRIRANLQGDFLHMVIGCHHMAIDGIGSTVVILVLAQLSRDPETPASALSTTAAAQQNMREHLTKMDISSPPEPIEWNTNPYHLPLLASEDTKHKTLNIRYPIPKNKLALLQDACRRILRDSSLYRAKDTLVSTSLIVGSLFGICVHRARHAAGLGHLYESTLGFASNLREKLALPSSYIGNALVSVGANLDKQAISSSDHGPLVSGVSTPDLYQLTNVALSMSEALDEYAGMLGTLRALEGRSSVHVSIRGLAFSDLHKLGHYGDYGLLGEVQDFGIPGNELGGVGWLLPNKPGKKKGYYELQVALERASIEELEKDGLFQWITGTGPTASKL